MAGRSGCRDRLRRRPGGRRPDDRSKLKDLRKALDKADGWADLETEDGDIALDLRQVVFVRGAPGEHRIGFSG